LRKPEAKVEGHELLGSVGGVDRDSKESSVDHSFLGSVADLEIADLKYARLAEVISLATRRDWTLKLLRSAGVRERR